MTEEIGPPVRARSGSEQTLFEHSVETARLCRKALRPYGFGNIGKLAGFFHDVGKAHPDVQLALDRGHDAPLSTEHAAWGVCALLFAAKRLAAKSGYEEAGKRLRPLFDLLAFLVGSHHRSMRDSERTAEKARRMFRETASSDAGRMFAKRVSSFLNARSRLVAGAFEAAAAELSSFESAIAGDRNAGAKRAFLARFLLGVLVSADRRSAGPSGGPSVEIGGGKPANREYERRECFLRADAAVGAFARDGVSYVPGTVSVSNLRSEDVLAVALPAWCSVAGRRSSFRVFSRRPGTSDGESSIEEFCSAFLSRDVNDAVRLASFAGSPVALDISGDVPAYAATLLRPAAEFCAVFMGCPFVVSGDAKRCGMKPNPSLVFRNGRKAAARNSAAGASAADVISHLHGGASFSGYAKKYDEIGREFERLEGRTPGTLFAKLASA